MDRPSKRCEKLKANLKQPRHLPPARQNYGLTSTSILTKSAPRIPNKGNIAVRTIMTKRSSSKASDEVAEKLVKLSVGSGLGHAVSVSAARPPPPPLKAEGWHSHTDFLTRSYEVPFGRRYSRKVAG